MNKFGMRVSLLVVLFLLILALISPVQSLARIGVGVGTGKIQLDEVLRPGSVYQLPEITVINTGDEASDYELDITYHEKQAEIRPEKSWFEFTPAKFYLEPGSVQSVAVSLSLPVKVNPGKYFAYLEARPLTTKESGGTMIGIAAASKLYFEISPANFFQAILFRLVSLWRLYSPIPQVIFGTIFVLVIYKFVASKISLDISLKTKKQTKKTPEESSSGES